MDFSIRHGTFRNRNIIDWLLIISNSLKCNVSNYSLSLSLSLLIKMKRKNPSTSNVDSIWQYRSTFSDNSLWESTFSRGKALKTRDNWRFIRSWDDYFKQVLLVSSMKKLCGFKLQKRLITCRTLLW